MLERLIVNLVDDRCGHRARVATHFVQQWLNPTFRTAKVWHECMYHDIVAKALLDLIAVAAWLHSLTMTSHGTALSVRTVDALAV